MRLSKKEADALIGHARHVQSQPSAPSRRRRAPASPYHTACHVCDETFTTIAGETRHMNSTGHRRYRLVLTPRTPPS